METPPPTPQRGIEVPPGSEMADSKSYQQVAVYTCIGPAIAKLTLSDTESPREDAHYEQLPLDTSPGRRHGRRGCGNLMLQTTGQNANLLSEADALRAKNQCHAKSQGRDLDTIASTPTFSRESSGHSSPNQNSSTSPESSPTRDTLLGLASEVVPERKLQFEEEDLDLIVSSNRMALTLTA
jgi:hypothetical protein